MAGGLGTRLSEETSRIPKPMVELAEKPILLHLMEYLASWGMRDFVILAGYKSQVIRSYFADMLDRGRDIEINFATHTITQLRPSALDWKVTILDTGVHTQVGGRIKHAIKTLGLAEDFFLTYGDGLSDVNVDDLIASHKDSGALATVTAVRPPGRFGTLTLDENKNVLAFSEKTEGKAGWINGGFFVLNPAVGDYIDGPDTVWEESPLASLAAAGKLNAHTHEGFWHPMDTLRDKQSLERLVVEDQAPWIRKPQRDETN